MFGLLAVGMVTVGGEDRPLPAIARRAMVDSLPALRTTEPVSAVVYGFRAMDTFGETFLLLAAGVSVVLLAPPLQERGGFIGEGRARRVERADTDRDSRDGGRAWGAGGGVDRVGRAGRCPPDTGCRPGGFGRAGTLARHDRPDP